MSKKILVACDSFKNSFSSLELASIIQKKLSFESTPLAVADGGEGTLEAIYFQDPKLKKIFCTVKDPLFRDHEIYYLYNQQEKIAYISLADTCGFQHLSSSERNPWITSSFGFGQCIQQALQQGARTIYLFLGSSCTNDAGVGMAEALGYQFLIKSKNPVLNITPKQFNNVDSIEHPKNVELINQCSFICVTDVTNPLLGPTGATMVYSPQKGADKSTIYELESQIEYIAKKISTISSIDPSTSGAGSAGGLGFGCMAFLGADNQSGSDFMIDLLNIKAKVQESDIVITGEGIIDQQTFHGKWVQNIARLAAKYNKLCIAICAHCQLTEQEIQSIPINSVFELYHQLPDQIDLEDSLIQLARVILEINEYIVHLDSSPFAE